MKSSPPRRTPSPTRAIALSFVWPGLGQYYQRRPRAAALYALPVVLVGLSLVGQLMGGLERFAFGLLDPSAAMTLMILIALLAAWRLLSMADAWTWLGGPRAVRGSARKAFLGLAAIVLVVHGVAGYYAWSFYDAGSRIFVGGTQNGDTTPPPTAHPTEMPPGSSPLPTPAEGPPLRPRITILLTGVDSAATRDHALTDTLLVATVDPETAEAAMISFPRDISNFQLVDGRTYSGKINSFMTWATNRPREFPGGPMPALMDQLSLLLGTPIEYYAAVDLDGFKRMIDIVGGVTVDNPRAINDPLYDWMDGRTGFRLPAGSQSLDGRTALAFVRSRQGAGDNDFTRAGRQQQLLVALRGKMTDPAMLPRLPAILDAAASTIRTNFPSDRISEMLQLASQVDDGEIERIILGPPTYAVHPPTATTGGIYTLRLHMDALADLSVRLFGEASAYWDGASTSAAP